jgi:hypothetical protein
MPADQPSAFNLEYLKKRSKRLLRECRAVDAEAIAWVQARLPRLRSLDGPALSTSIGLADVQHAVAVERGFSSWGDLTRYGDPLSRLLTAIRGAHIVTLRRELRSFSGLAGANAFAAAALGDANVARVDGDEIVRAAVRGSTDEVRLMLTCGFPPDTVGESGATALQEAAWHGQVHVVELLLAHGASPTVRDDVYGETALDWAHQGSTHAHGAEEGCLEAARLIQHALSSC